MAGTALLLSAVSCRHVDNERIPWSDVRIAFSTMGEWNIYGVPGAYTYRSFIKSEHVPADYPYTAMTYTGFGGVLLVGDIFGRPVAYDLACPVEVRYNVRVAIDPDTHLAVCPVCHSCYDVFENYGHPVAGVAAEREYGLTLYHVGSGPGGEYMYISH